MDRRAFFKFIAGVSATAATGLAPTTARGRILLQRSPVAGFQYYDGEDAIQSLRLGDPLRLLREPENGHDQRAVQVFCRHGKLGYVPRAENIAVAQLLDDGKRLEASVTRIDAYAADPWARVRFSIWL